MSDLKFIKQSTKDINDDKYLLECDKVELGYADIHKDNAENNIYIFIHPEHRSNGYGYKLFQLATTQLKDETKLPHIILNVDKKNVHINNIIAKCGGLLVGEDELNHWVLKL